ncbi:MAG: hypothetical protein PCFJNLEI_03446 [Verrucomicrobiae bacterium]|nr:hypothetical protein [Verrucomicrobiae bacterium]
MPGIDGHDRALHSFKDKTVIVVVFTCNHCPYAQAYEDRLVTLQRDFADQGVQLIAINSNDGAGYPEDSFDNMVRRAQKKQFNFPYLRDETQRAARSYGAEYTPEAFVFNSQRELCYVGRVDDNWQHPEKARSHDLRSAIEAVLAGQPVKNPVTHAIGCTIKWKL